MKKHDLSRVGSAITVLSLFAIGIGVSHAADGWWEISDQAFAQKYAQQAFGQTIADQSTVAWMLFARANQQIQIQGLTRSKWESWPSNEDTFSPAVHAFVVTEKVLTRPHFQTSKAEQLRGDEFHAGKFRTESLIPVGGEEVTRNQISYDYIIKNGLNRTSGIKKFFISPTAQVQLPLGAVEVKAVWSDGAVNGAYQISDPSTQPPTIYSLLGLHIMAKFAPTPSDAYHSEEPSWFWTTFEFKENEGLASAQGLITYKDVASSDQVTSLLKEAGLSGTAFANYRCNGSQIRFSDAVNKTIILGNTLMEDFAAIPENTSPTKWTKWNTSCHTCHAAASGKMSGETYPFKLAQFKDFIGVIGSTNPPLDTYRSLDFLWSIRRAR